MKTTTRLALTTAALLAAISTLHATDYTWVLPGSGNWDTSSDNWNDGTTNPTKWINGAGNNVSFPGMGATAAISLYSNMTLGKLSTNGGGTVVISGAFSIDVTNITTAGTSGSNGSIDMSSKLTGNHDFTYHSTGTGGNGGRLNMKTAADYTGNTYLTGGAELTTTTTNALPTGTKLDIASTATFTMFTGSAQKIALLTGSGTVQGRAPAGTTLTIETGSGVTGTFSGKITYKTAGDIMNIAVTGAGTQVFTGTASNYTGSTTVSGGTLSIAKLADGGANSSIGAAANTADKLILNGGTLKYTGGAQTTNRLFSLQSSSSLDASGTGALNFTNTGTMGFNSGTAAKTLTLTGISTAGNTLAAIISDNTGATSLSKSGAGKWILTGANTFSGTTSVSVGTLATGATGTFGAGDVSVAAGASLIFGNSASIGDLQSLTFTNTSSIALSFVGAEILGSAFNSTSSTALAAGTYDANALNTFFSTSAFTGTGSLTVIPESSAFAALAGLASLGFISFRRRARC